jgi:3-oxoacyl-[acyl-carrier protein] reductase
MSQTLSSKTVLVTGAASGIGLATVELFASHGARVALNHLEADTRGPEEVARMRSRGFDVIAAVGDLGRLDFLVNNAGTSATKEPIALAELDQMTEEFWQAIISTNLIGAFRCTKFAATALKSAGGAVVNTASVGGLDMVGSSIAYGASKAGLINMTKNLARALAPNVRVNAVAPGYVESGWTETWPEAKKASFVQKSLLKRACMPSDVAEVIYFLCCGTSMVTGQTVIVDGGLTLG